MGYKKLTKVSDCDWYCDECGAFLGSQTGFHYFCDTWTCTVCGNVNYINEDNIIDEDDDESYCNCCEHSSEFPNCKAKCPYEFY